MKKEKLIRMLREIRDLAGEASLTGMFQKGASILITHYNACLKTARQQNYLSDNEPFLDLKENASIDEVGISAGLLSAYLIEARSDE